jgi:hypothetical protein
LNQEVIVRASDDFYGSSSFSNVAILMDENDAKKCGTDNGFCYCKVYESEYFIIIIIKFNTFSLHLDFIDISIGAIYL